MQHGEIQIAEHLSAKTFGGIGFVLAVFEAATGEYDGEIAVRVGVRIAHAAAEKDHGVIQQRAGAILDALELLQEPSELLHLIALHFDEAFDGLGTLAVMGEAVVAAAQAEGGGLEIATDLERGDARGIRLQGEGDEVIHHG